MFNEELAERLLKQSEEDIAHIDQKNKAYGESWKQRGGIGAFMMAARKWDRLENMVKDAGYDIFNDRFIDTEDAGGETILDQIGDLRRYLMLIEDEIFQMKEREVRDASSD